MNAKSLVVLLVLVVGAVVATLFALREGNDAGPMPLAATSAQTDRAAAERAALAQGTVGTDPGAAATADDLQRTAAPVADAGKDSGAAVAIRGRLVDRHGAPRAGIELALMTWPGFDGFEFDVMPEPPRRERGKRDRPTFTTRADGTFTFTLAKDRAGMIEIDNAELVFAKGSPQVGGRKGDQDLGDVVALRSGVVAGIVQDAQGRAVADVKVAATAGQMVFGTTSSATSDDEGRFRLGKLRPGTLTIRTASGRFLPTVQELELQDEEQRSDVVLVVRPGNAIAGQVVDDRGVGVAGMKVGSKRNEVRGAIDIERFTPDEATNTDANGYFTLSGLSEETATVRAFGPGHSSAVAADVAVGTGNLVLRVERYGSLEGVLQGQDGTPIAGSRVRVQRGGEPAGGDEMFMMEPSLDDHPGAPGRGALTAADGTFRLESVKPGAVTLMARGPTHQPVRHPGINVLPAQTTKGVRLIADLGAIARVKVVDEAGKPVADAQVRARRAPEQGSSSGMRFETRAVALEDTGNGPMPYGGDRLPSAKTDADGLAVLQGLPAGNLELTATHADYAPAIAARVTTPKSGTVEADLQLRTPGHAVITVLGTDGSPQPGVELQVRAAEEQPGPGPRPVTSDDQGEARVGPLAPGNYTAALRRPNQATRVGDAMMVFGDDQDVIESSAQPFTIVAGETVRVELRRPVLARVHGTVTGVDGPVAGCVIGVVSGEGGGLDLPGFGGRDVTTAADGTFSVDDVESGTYRIKFGKPNQVVKATAEVVVPPDTPEVRCDLELRTGTLRVQVVAEATGEPIAKAEVEVARAEDAPASGGPVRRETMAMVTMAVNDSGEGSPEMTTMTLGLQRAHTDENGVATIDDVPAGEYTLRATHKKYAPAELKGQVVAERRLTDAGRVSLAGAGQVRGKVLGADGKQVRMAMVQHRKAGSEQWSQPTMAMSGSYRITGLATGKYTLRARQMGPQQSGEWSPEVEVDVKAGETATADLQLPK